MSSTNRIFALSRSIFRVLPWIAAILNISYPITHRRSHSTLQKYLIARNNALLPVFPAQFPLKLSRRTALLSHKTCEKTYKPWVKSHNPIYNRSRSTFLPVHYEVWDDCMKYQYFREQGWIEESGPSVELPDNNVSTRLLPVYLQQINKWYLIANIIICQVKNLFNELASKLKLAPLNKRNTLKVLFWAIDWPRVIAESPLKKKDKKSIVIISNQSKRHQMISWRWAYRMEFQDISSSVRQRFCNNISAIASAPVSKSGWTWFKSYPTHMTVNIILYGQVIYTPPWLQLNFRTNLLNAMTCS